MATVFDEIRAKYPKASGLSDEQIVERISTKTGKSLGEITDKLGYKPERGVLRAGLDTLQSVGENALGTAKTVVDAVAPGSAPSQWLDEQVKASQKSRSFASRVDDSRLDDVMKKEGVGEQVGGALKWGLQNPAKVGAMAVGSYGPALGVMRLAKGAGAVGQLATGSAFSGAASGGDAAGTAYDLVQQTDVEILAKSRAFQELRAQGMSLPAIKHELGTRAARKASIVPGIIGALSGLVGVERLVAGGKQAAGNMFARAGKTALGEGLPEGFDEGVTQYSGQAAAAEYNPRINPMQGVAGAATLGVMTGGGIGAVVGLASPKTTERSVLPNANLPPEKKGGVPPGPTAPAGEEVGDFAAMNPYDLGGGVTALKRGIPISPDGYNAGQGDLWGGYAPDSPSITPDAPTGDPLTLSLGDKVKPAKAAKQPKVAATAAPAAKPAPTATNPLPHVSAWAEMGDGVENYPSWEELPVYFRQAWEKEHNSNNGSIATADAIAKDAQRVTEFFNLHKSKFGDKAQPPKRAGYVLQALDLQDKGLVSDLDMQGFVDLLAKSKYGSIDSWLQKNSGLVAQPRVNEATKPSDVVVTKPVAEQEIPASQTVNSLDEIDFNLLIDENVDEGVKQDTGRRAIQKILNTAHGDKVGAAVFDMTMNNLSQAEAAEKHGVTQPTISRAVGTDGQKRVAKAIAGLKLTPQHAQALQRVFTSDADMIKQQAADTNEGQILEATQQSEVDRTDMAVSEDSAPGTKPNLSERDSVGQSAIDVVGANTAGAQAEAVLYQAEQAAAAFEEAAADAEAEGNMEAAEKLRTRAEAVRNEAVQKLSGLEVKAGREMQTANADLKEKATKTTKGDKIKKKVAEKNAETRKRVRKAPTKEEIAAKAAAEEAALTETTTDKATKAWNQHNAATGNHAGTFDEQPADLQKQWKEFVSNGASSLRDFTKLVEDYYRGDNALRHGRTLRRTIPATGKPTVRTVTVAELDSSEGITRAKAILSATGMDFLLDEVVEWKVNDDETDDGAEVTYADGGYTVTLGGGLMSPGAHVGYTRHVFTHEIGHIADVGALGEGTVYSSQPELKVQFDTNTRQITGLVGVVARELYALWQSSPAWQARLDYPFNLKGSRDIRTAARLQAEIFAQLFSYYSHPATQADIDKYAPNASAFMKDVYEHIAATKEVRQQAYASAGERAETFHNRGPGRDVQGSQGASGRAEQKYSIPRTSQEFVQKLSEFSPKDFGSKLKDLAWTNRETTARRTLLGSMTTEQIIQQFGVDLTTLREYGRLRRLSSTTSMDVIQRAANVDNAWNLLSKEKAFQVSDLMQDSTLSGIHPDEEFDSEANDHVGNDQREDYARVRAKWDKLDKNQRKVFTMTRDLFKDLWSERRDTYKGSMTRLFERRIKETEKLLAEAQADGDTKAEKEYTRKLAQLTKSRDDKIAEFNRQLSEVKGPYFPLLRFGEFIVIGESKALRAAEAELESSTNPDERKELKKRIEKMRKQEQHYIVESYETKAEALRAVKDLSETMNARWQYGEQFHNEQRRFTLAGLNQLEGIFDSEVDKKTAAALKDAATELYARSSPAFSALRRQLKRQGITGAAKDMRRAFAMASQKEAHYLGMLKVADEISDVLFRMEREAKDKNPNFQLISQEISARHMLDMTVSEQPWQSLLTSASYWTNLALSPAFVFANMMQPVMTSLPQLAGKFGVGKSTAAFWKAYTDVASGVTAGIKKAKDTGNWMGMELDISKVGNENEQKMLKELLDRGIINVTMEYDLGTTARSSNRMLSLANKVATWPVHHTEVINRVSVSLSAYRLAVAQGMSLDKAVEYAYNAVHDTQFDYSPSNTARLMRADGPIPLAKLIFQFRRYQQGMIYLLAKNSKEAFAALDPADRKAAKRTLFGLTAVNMAFAGALGVPFAFPLLMLAKLFGLMDDKDEPFDPEVAFRNAMVDLTGSPEVGRAISKGLPTLLGVDVSKNIGAGDVLNPLPFMRTNTSSGRDFVGSMIVNVAGAPFGMLANWVDGLMLMNDGQVMKGLEKWLPRVVANPVKAARYATEGMTTKAGEVTVKPEKFNEWNIATRAAGFTSAKESDYWTATIHKAETDRVMKDKRSKIIREVAQAHIQRKGVDEAIAEWKAWNQRNKDKPDMVIPYTAIQSAIKSRGKNAALREIDETGMGLKPKQQYRKEEFRFAQ